MTRLLAALLLSCACAVGCTVKLDKTSADGLPRNECTESSQCSGGKCWNGACSAFKGDLSSLLIEATSPLGAQGVGGLRDLQILSGLESSNEDTKIDLHPATEMHGFIAPGTLCPGVTSVPVRVTLTPREESYGLQAQSYVVETRPSPLNASPCATVLEKDFPGQDIPFIDEFSITAPSNALYDLYLEPLTAPTFPDGGAPTGCAMVPQLSRGVQPQGCLKVLMSAPLSVPVTVPWPADATGDRSLDGWTLSAVHPITGDVLSDTVTLRDADRHSDDKGGKPYTRSLRFSQVPGDAIAKELVRLAPPTGVVAPTVYAERAALQALLGDTAVFPAIGPFPAPVLLDGWVWEKGTEADHPVAVPGTVTLTATKLDGVNPGIFATFTETTTVGEDGRLSVRVLPGDYRARVTPRVGLGLAAAETTFSVACAKTSTSGDCLTGVGADAGTPSQAGKVLSVPRAATLSGSLVNAGDGTAVDRATAEARPGALDMRACGSTPDASTCGTDPLGVLDISLGEDAFVPRPSTGTVENGAFSIKEVDCGSCTTESPAIFDFSVRSQDGSRYPWFVRSGLSVGGDVELGRLTVPLPIIHHGVVEIPQVGQDAIIIPNALIRAYVLRDQTGAVIASPAGLSSCQAAATSKNSARPARCIRSVLQVAETRAAPDGHFELVLPSALE